MKKALYAVAVIATIAIAGWNYQQNKELELSELALANVEALANTEDRDDDCYYCPGAECYLVVATPGGNWTETHQNHANRFH